MATVREKKLLNLLHEIVSQSFFPFAVFTVEGKLIDCSDDFCNLTGYPREELYELRMVFDLTAAEWKAEEQKQLRRLLHLKIPVHYKKEIITKEGRHVPVHVCCGCTLDSIGDIKYLYQIFVISEEDHDHEKLHSEFLRRLSPSLQAKPYEKLLEDLEHKDPTIRLQAIIALGKQKDPRSAQLLLPLTRDLSRDIRVNTALSLGEIGDPASAPELLRLLRTDISNSVRWAAAIALGNYNPTPSITSALEEAKTHLDPDIRRAAKDSLAKINRRA